MSLTIRPAVEADAERIALGEHATAASPGLLNALPGEIPVADFRETISRLAGTGSGLYLVAEDESGIIGHLLLDPLPLAQNAHVCSLNIVVYPGSRDRGVGRALLESAIDWAKGSVPIEKIELRVRAGNARAIHLYESFGFVEEGRIRRRLKLADGSYADDIAMALFVGGNP